LPFININQIKLFYVENKIEGIPLLFIHGWLGSSLEWIYQFSYFNTKSHIIILDLPGYGKSDKPDAKYSIDFFSKVIKEFLKELGYDKVILIGHSLGGLIAQNIAIQNPTMVNKLILISTSAISQRKEKKFLLFWVNVIFKLAYVNFLKNTIKRINSEEKENSAFRRQVKNALDIPKSVVLNTFKHMTSKFKENKKISEIFQPTLILYGTADKIISQPEINTLGNIIPNSETVLIENYPHRVMIKNHEVVNNKIEIFIKD
jgi:4,5:9,10-diseco-3-hydroxy-5,9,17-trioxoandrosta-1(10),2-diene-4-oate hydrolase